MWMIFCVRSEALTVGSGKRSRFSVTLPMLMADFGQYCTQLRQPMQFGPKTGLPPRSWMLLRGQTFSQVPQPTQASLAANFLTRLAWVLPSPALIRAKAACLGGFFARFFAFDDRLDVANPLEA